MFCELDAPPEKEKEEPVGLAVIVVPSCDNCDADLETSAVDSPPPKSEVLLSFFVSSVFLPAEKSNPAEDPVVVEKDSEPKAEVPVCPKLKPVEGMLLVVLLLVDDTFSAKPVAMDAFDLKANPFGFFGIAPPFESALLPNENPLVVSVLPNENGLLVVLTSEGFGDPNKFLLVTTGLDLGILGLTDDKGVDVTFPIG